MGVFFIMHRKGIKYMKHYYSYLPNSKKQEKMIQAQQKIIDSLTDQNKRLMKKQDDLKNQTAQLYNGANELKNIIADFTKYNTDYASLLRDLNICESEYEAAKNAILEIKKKYKNNLKHVIRKMQK